MPLLITVPEMKHEIILLITTFLLDLVRFMLGSLWLF